MSREKDDFPCPNCGEPVRKKALRCRACGTANPLQESTSFGERIGLSGTLFLLAVVGVVLLVLSVWLVYELLALGRLNPYLVAASGLLVFVCIGRAIARRWRR